jgi:hypothetical protein
MNRKVAIVGRAATASYAPYDDHTWDIWGLGWVTLPRETLLFDIHHPDFKRDEDTSHFNSHHNPNGEYFELINGKDVPILCHPDAIGEGPRKFHRGRAFPYEEVLRLTPTPYLDCTISYMLGYAILRRYEAISLWGTHLRGSQREQFQLPSVTYMIGLAQGRGIDVTVSPGSPLMASGYERGRYGITQTRRWWPGL